MEATKRYSQFRAMLGIAKASFITSIRSFSSIFFSLFFPLIFILVFGFIGQGSSKPKLAILEGTDTNNVVYQSLEKISQISFEKNLSTSDIDAKLLKGQLDGALRVTSTIENGAPKTNLELTTSAASPQQGGVLRQIVSGLVDKTNLALTNSAPFAILSEKIVEGREYKAIDFILPGQLGFSLLSIGIFGTTFLFLRLRQTLVIKRFFTTPVSKFSIIGGEALSSLAFALIQATVILSVGYFAFGFTLIHGFATFFEMLILAALGLMVFLGLGFVISSLGDDERTVSPIANLVTMPQFLLAGTFFPIDNFPGWLQPISRALPLTHLNDAMRKVAFEGASLSAVFPQIIYLLIWAAVVYALAVKIFRWELRK